MEGVGRMEIYRFDQGVCRTVHKYDSNFLMTKLLVTEGITHIGCMYIEPGEVVGYHQATVDQLFIVVHGEGVVRTTEEDRTVIQKGQAAFWKQEEWHETKATTSMVVIVTEAENMRPEHFLQLVSES